MKKRDVKNTFIDLAKQNLIISSDIDKTMCLKNTDGEKIFSFPLLKDADTLTSLKCAVDDLKLKIDRAMNKNWL